MTSTQSHDPRRAGRVAAVAVLGLAWVGIGIGVGWAIGFLADRLTVAQHRGLVLGTLGLCAVVLCAWAYGTHLLYLEIRAGVEEATNPAPTRRRTGYRYVAIAAAPIIGLLIGLSSSGISRPGLSRSGPPGSGIPGHGGAGSSRPGVSTSAPAHASTSAKKAPQEVRSPVAASTYVVRPGDSLTSIAEHFYGTGNDWPVIARANAGRLHEPSGARLVDPSLLPVGLELAIPEVSSLVATPPPVTTGVDVSATRDRELFGALAGFGLIGAALFARRQLRRRSYQAMRTPVGGVPPRLEETDAEIEAQLRPLVVAELPEWIDAANRLLFTGLVSDRSLVVPKVSVVRAGPLGVELLLDEPCNTAPEGFVVADGGRTWLLDRRFELEAVRAAAGPDAQPLIAGLVPVAEDATGSYLVACGPGESLGVRGSPGEIARGLGAIVAHLASAPWGEVDLYRVGEASFVGAEEIEEIDLDVLAGLDEGTQRDPLWRAGLAQNQPLVLVEDPDLADEVRAAAPAIVSVVGPLADAERLLYFENETVTIEPLGLCLPALLASTDELEAVARLTRASRALPSARHGQPSALPAPDGELPIAGPIEVRILREVPDLVGDVNPDKAGPDVVQLVAYLALHGGQATSSKLRDVFGVYRADASRRQQTVWNATSHARQALGIEYFPRARGSAPYRISGEVTCDWPRFKEITAIGRALEQKGEAKRAIDTFAIGLELLGEGVPGSHDSIVGRYVWLDAEQFLVEIESTIVQAAYSMAMLSIEHRPYAASLEDAAWAIERGRVISPDARPLREAAMVLADAREETDAVAAEFHAAVEAVDALEIGEDVDPTVETLYQALTRTRPTTPPAGTAFA